jgi:hypothetical protein
MLIAGEADEDFGGDPLSYAVEPAYPRGKAGEATAEVGEMSEAGLAWRRSFIVSRVNDEGASRRSSASSRWGL